LEWKDVDFKNKLVILHTHKSKGGNLRARKIPMVAKLESILERLKEGRLPQQTHVFWHKYYSAKSKCSKEGPYTDRKSMMTSLCTKVDVPYFRFHPLRHFGATMLERAGVPIRTIQMLLGHSNRATTEIYLHSAGDEEKAAMEGLENVFETKVPEKSQKNEKGLQLFSCNPL